MPFAKTGKAHRSKAKPTTRVTPYRASVKGATANAKLAKAASLNIKNRETYELARELASETGESLTAAVTAAIRERLAAIRHRADAGARLVALREISARMAALDKGPFVDHGELLYDEHGLPK